MADTETVHTDAATDAGIDAQRTEQFAERMMGVLNDASLALMLSVGHRTGLLDTMADAPPGTSAEIATAAGLQERYVREWLGAMTVGGVVTFDPTTGCYELPAAHAASLTRAAGPGNLAGTMQFVSLLAGVESDITECFREGGGVPYSAYHEFHRLMAEDSAAVNDAALLDTIVPLVPGLTERLTAGIDVADVGCGSGHALNLLATAFPASRFVGFDFSEEAIAAGRREAESAGPGQRPFRGARRRGTRRDGGLRPRSPRSTPSTTRPSRRSCWPGSPRPCDQTGCS